MSFRPHTDRGASPDHGNAGDSGGTDGRPDPSSSGPARDADIVPLLASDVDELRDFYARAYPANWFDPRMLETGCYMGIRGTAPEARGDDTPDPVAARVGTANPIVGRLGTPDPVAARVGTANPVVGRLGALLAVSGIHVYSPRERVGVLGNVATLPEARRRGLGMRVCRELCRKLEAEGLRIGLNVARENRAAIRCYEALGFVHEVDYEERSIRIRRASARVSE